MDGPTRAESCYVFERCRLDPVSRTLTRDGQKVPLQGRLFDVLLYLVHNAGPGGAARGTAERDLALPQRG